jgi:ribosome-binding protein aMBF1 (putative translation factor)
MPSTSSLLTADDVRELIRRAVEKEGSQSALAAKMDVSPAYLGDVMKGRRELGHSIVSYFGLTRDVRYRKISTT